MKDKNTNNFEGNLVSLQNIVNELNNSELPLEEVMKKFEQGMLLSQQCQKKLDEVKEKVEVIVNSQQTKKLEVT